jgi:hypothetical protein
VPIEWLLVALLLAGVAVLLALRLGRARVSAPPTHPALPQPTTPAALGPGDVLTFWDGRAAIVTTALDCTEELHGRATRWRWLLLDDGRVLQVMGDALTLFERSELVPQGTPAFYRFTAPPEAGGLLRQFEERVRSGTAALEPVRWQGDDGAYTLRSTGTFRAHVAGAAPGAVWADIADDPAENVYFTFEGYGGAVDGVVGLGIWTTHILLLFGRPLPPADVVGCYRPDDASRSTC